MGPSSETPVKVYFLLNQGVHWLEQEKTTTTKRKKKEEEEATHTFFSQKLSASNYTLQILYDIW